MMDEQDETLTRRRLIYVTERLKEIPDKLERGRAEVEALRNAPDRDQRRLVYLVERTRILREERGMLSAERLELKAALARG